MAAVDDPRAPRPKPGGSNVTDAGESATAGRTVIVIVFPFNAKTLTDARNETHSLSCCSNAEGTKLSSKKC